MPTAQQQYILFRFAGSVRRVVSSVTMTDEPMREDAEHARKEDAVKSETQLPTIHPSTCTKLYQWTSESYAHQAGSVWPGRGNHILAQYNDEAVVVYQAYKPEIANYAGTSKNNTSVRWCYVCLQTLPVLRIVVTRSSPLAARGFP